MSMPTVAVCLSLLLAGCGQADGPPGSTGPPVREATPSTAETATPPSTVATARPTAEPPTPEPLAELAPPDRLHIPALHLDEQLVDLGLADDGSMEVPDDPDRAGWFTGGGRPGGRGPTVLAGHVDSTEGPAVFGSLTRLGSGDEVVLENAAGEQVTYRVDRVADYPKGTFPTHEVFGATVGDELRLITCTGAWDTLASSYEDNRVVFASAVPGQ